VWPGQEQHGLVWHPTSECSNLEWLQVFHHICHDLEFHPSVLKQGWPIKYNANVDRFHRDVRVTYDSCQGNSKVQIRFSGCEGG